MAFMHEFHLVARRLITANSTAPTQHYRQKIDDSTTWKLCRFFFYLIVFLVAEESVNDLSAIWDTHTDTSLITALEFSMGSSVRRFKYMCTLTTSRLTADELWEGWFTNYNCSQLAWSINNCIAPRALPTFKFSTEQSQSRRCATIRANTGRSVVRRRYWVGGEATVLSRW